MTVKLLLRQVGRINDIVSGHTRCDQTQSKQPPGRSPETGYSQNHAVSEDEGLGDDLRQVCNPVDRFGCDMSRLMDDMLRLMRHKGGIGLAGPQVGILWRIFVAEIHGDALCLANPEIRHWTGQSKMLEGCLSLPDVNVKVLRHKDIDVVGYDPLGNKREYRIGGLWAHVIQHEIDHLNGVLITDHSLPGQ